MKILFLISIITIFISCAGENTSSNETKQQTRKQKTITPDFQTIIDSAKVEGSILIYDFKADNYYSNDFEWAKKGKLPASTFKITNSIIAIETAVVNNEHTLFKWNGEERRLKTWEQDLTFKDAFHFSCVPCYQGIARKIGAKKMIEYLDKLNYGNMKVNSGNIDMFWLEGESQITQFQQIDFLRRFYYSKLPIAKRTEKIMKKMMLIEENDQYKLSGKTGWSIRNGNNNGWFVGYVETSNKVYFFASNIKPKNQFEMSMFPMIRKVITYKALEKMEIIKSLHQNKL